MSIYEGFDPSQVPEPFGDRQDPKHTDTSRSGDLVERLRGDWPEILVEKHWMMDSDAIDKQREEAADRIEQLEREKAVVSDLWEQQKEIALDYLADCNALSAEIERLQLLCDLNAVPAGIIEDRGRMEERAAIVAWLRREDDRLTNGGVLTDADYLASAIEAGEHLK